MCLTLPNLYPKHLNGEKMLNCLEVMNALAASVRFSRVF